MPTFRRPSLGHRADLSLVYEIVGQGQPIALVHGFASNRQTNWIGPGWYTELERAGRQILALDVLGHGSSDKSHDADDYSEDALAADVIAMLDHAKIDVADYLGYSMGGFIGVSALAQAPKRFGRAVLAGIGKNYTAGGLGQAEAIARGLLAPSLADVVEPVPRMFRRFAEAGRNDLAALASCMLRPRRSLGKADLNHVSNSVLVIAGDQDMISGPPEPLAESFMHGRSVTIPGKDHMSAVGDKAMKAAVLAFLNET